MLVHWVINEQMNISTHLRFTSRFIGILGTGHHVLRFNNVLFFVRIGIMLSAPTWIEGLP